MLETPWRSARGAANDNTVKGMDVLGTKTMALAGAMGALLMLAGCGGGGGDAGATPTSNATAFSPTA